MATRKSQIARRRGVKRNISPAKPAWLRWLARRDVAGSVLYVVLFTAAAGFVAINARQTLPYREGQVIAETLISRVEFVSIDSKATETDRENARRLTPSVYQPNLAYLNQIGDRLNNLVLLVADEKITRVSQLDQQEVRSLALTDQTLRDLRRFVNADEKPNDEWRQTVKRFRDGLADSALLSKEDHQYEKLQTEAEVVEIRHPTQGERARMDLALISVGEPDKFIKNVRTSASVFPPLLQRIAVSLVMKDMLQPTYLRDEDATEKKRQAKATAVQVTRRVFDRNDVLVAAGVDEVKRFGENDIRVIEQERAAYANKVSPWRRYASMAGVFGVLLFGAIGLWLYFSAYYQKVMRNAMRGLAIVCLLLLCQVMAWGLTSFGSEWTYLGAIFPTLMAAVVLSIVYDRRFAFTIGAMHTLLVMISLNLPVSFGMVLLVGVYCMVAQLREVRTRSKLVLAGLWSGLAMAMVVAMVGVMGRPMHLAGAWERLLSDAVIAMSTGLVTGLFVQGVLPGIEWLFKVSTSMTLKELNDASHPLLRRLAERAPGTYQHSLRIADMAEAAAERIGASSLLCRVGAMYHDVGKMNKPMYFVENQGGGPNRHDKLSPAMSVLIIVGHVKDGAEMAREYRLPAVIRHFIDSHHGTTLVEYFYHAARKRKEQESADVPMPSEFEFRYPGPKPQTKEAAIIMLCDGVEGAARSVVEPTPVRLEQLVHQMAIKRLMDGQFDECNMTLQDLHQIETAVTKTLCAIYHGRVAYPGDVQQERQDEHHAAVTA